MAKPRETAPDPPVESEEEEEEEEASSQEGSESESEPEPSHTQNFQNAKQSSSTPAPAAKKPEAPTPKDQPAATSSSSSEDEESGSETDSETPIIKPDPNIKPVASMPMDDPQNTTTATKKPRSKPNSSRPTSGAGAKRPAPAAATGGDGDDKKDAKRPKRKSEAENENSEKKGNSTDDAKKLFQRLWSEEDEIAILKGMIDYSAKEKAEPVADLNAFLEFIKKSLHIDVSKTQLQDKIRRLKKKYENNAGKEKKGNKERTFSKPHEQKAYDLSKKIWGNEKNGGEETIESPKVNGTALRKSRSRGAVATTPKVDEVVEKLKEVKDLVSEKNVVEGLKNVSFGPDCFGIEEWVVKNGMELIKDEKKRAELEKKWRELKVKEIELFANRSELMAEQTKLILDSLKSLGH